MNPDQRREFHEAMADSMANPIDLSDRVIPGLPSDPDEARAYMWYLDAQWDKRACGREFRKQARESFIAWMNGDGEGPWQD